MSAPMHRKTETILKRFKEISQFPRKSGHEKALRDFLIEWATDHDFEHKTAPIGNLVIKVPASLGYESAPITVIQGHLDMVCEKAKGSSHDFLKDPIKHIYDGGWLRADQTTLGADNGIAVAMAMVAALDDETPHPPLELFFTVEEETGLDGASALKAGFLEGRILLNIDSEDEGVLTVGCAGGRDSKLKMHFETGGIETGHKGVRIVAGGMTGGHSGVDIDIQRANAIQVLARTLNTLMDSIDLRLGGFEGGSAHNAIPRDAEVWVSLPANEVEQATALLAEKVEALKTEFAKTDPNLNISIVASQESHGDFMNKAGSQKAINFLLALPHGVANMSTDIVGLVETSNNLAMVDTKDGVLSVLTSQRSSVMEKLHFLTERIESTTRLGGGVAESGVGYPSWEPNMQSPLLAKCQNIYKELYNKDAVVEIIHAGLECGIIGDRQPGMDMISFGPTIVDPHSPNERIEIKTIGLVWDFLAALLKSIQ